MDSLLAIVALVAAFAFLFWLIRCFIRFAALLIRNPTVRWAIIIGGVMVIFALGNEMAKSVGGINVFWFIVIIVAVALLWKNRR